MLKQKHRKYLPGEISREDLEEAGKITRDEDTGQVVGVS